MKSFTQTLQEAVRSLRSLWSTTRFATREISAYAERMMVGETRKGVQVMSLTLMALLLSALVLYGGLGFASTYLYTSGVLALLAFHIFLSARSVNELRALHLLGIALLTVSGTALVSIAHQTGGFSAALYASIVLLFMVVPMVPWGMREAGLITIIVYAVLTASTLSVPNRFDTETLWTLQFVMLAAGVTNLCLVALYVSVRKHDVLTRYGLEQSQRRLEHLSSIDPLTGAWNRRFLHERIPEQVERWRESGSTIHYAAIDLDDFKPLNDSFGHDFGDQVLRWLSESFRDAVGTHGHLVRLGGDEFALLFADLEPLPVLEDGCDALKALARASSRRPAVNVSIGLATLAPDAPPDLDAMYKAADLALYEAKRRKAHGGGDPNVVRAPAGFAVRRGAKAPEVPVPRAQPGT